MVSGALELRCEALRCKHVPSTYGLCQYYQNRPDTLTPIVCMASRFKAHRCGAWSRSPKPSESVLLQPGWPDMSPGSCTRSPFWSKILSGTQNFPRWPLSSTYAPFQLSKCRQQHFPLSLRWKNKTSIDHHVLLFGRMLSSTSDARNIELLSTSSEASQETVPLTHDAGHPHIQYSRQNQDGLPIQWQNSVTAYGGLWAELQVA